MSLPLAPNVNSSGFLILLNYPFCFSPPFSAFLESLSSVLLITYTHPDLGKLDLFCPHSTEMTLHSD